MRLLPAIIAVLLFLFALSAPTPADVYDDFLSVDEIGASALMAKRPEADGRGVVIAVLDTGVDMGVEGLRSTSTGEVKVIDAVDFSGEGKVALSKAFFETVGGEKVLKAKKAWVKGVDSLPLKSVDGKYFMGVLDEARFKTGSLKDLNGNGRTDDEFTVVVFKTAEGELTAFIDRSADHDISGEEPLLSYRKSLRAFSFPSADPAKPQHLINCALTIDEDGKSVNLHIPSHSHGTHVAGICAGYMIKGRKGFDGIAPGAKVISCKISNNAIGGATTTKSMKKAFEFVAEYAKEHDMPVVISMSFGVGSEVEGSADMDAYVDKFCLENPRIPVVISAGNEGPGLSTVGCPAASYGAISIGASLTARGSKALLGGATGGHEIFTFSSRGGELAKPDVIAPGIASSAVPNYEKKDLMRGTSMAAPEASGAVALILSAVVAGNKDARWNSFMIKRALKTTAKALPGYTVLDQGAGLIQADKALVSLEKALLLKGEEKIMGYAMKTLSPSLPEGTSPAAFYRTPWSPTPSGLSFTVAPLFTASATADERKEFYRTFRLTSDAPFLAPDRDSAYINGETALQLRAIVNGDRIKSPGLHTGRITARSEGGDEFELQVTVVVPFPTEQGDGQSVKIPEFSLRPGRIRRMYFMVPAGCGDVIMQVSAPEGKTGAATFSVFDPEGREVEELHGDINSTDGKRRSEARVGVGTLRPCGIYEIVAAAPLTLRESSTVAASVDFFFLRAGRARITSHKEGGLPEGEMEMENLSSKPFLGKIKARLQGHMTDEKVKMEGDSIKRPFTSSPGIRRVRTELELSPRDYGRFTDITAMVLDDKGKAVALGAFTYRKLTVDFDTEGRISGEYTLEIRGGLATEDEAKAAMRIRQYFYRDESAVAFRQDGREGIAIFAGYPRMLTFAFEATPPMIPKGAKLFGEALFIGSADERVWLKAPLLFEMKK